MRFNFEKYQTQIWLLLLSWLLFLLVAWLTPPAVLNTQPATGGDTGSHFYPLYTMTQHGLPHLNIRVWNPGNLMGEPHFLHYFPGPYLIMALLSIFMPIGLAFNLGTIGSLFAFPICVLWGLGGLGYRLHTCFIAALFSFIYVFNESHSMWGANAQSLLAGQFAHMYAVDILFLLIGCIGWELRKGKHYYLSAFLVAALAITHTYILLLAPFVLLAFAVGYTHGTFKQRLKYLFWVGTSGILLALWFIIPQLINAKWTLPIPIKWIFTDFWKEVTPDILKPFLYFYVVLVLVYLVLISLKLIDLKDLGRELLFWLIPIIASIGMFLCFPSLGLADIRAIPQIQHFIVIIAAVLLGRILSLYNQWVIWIITAALVPASFLWVQNNIKNYPHWIRWNYSSWEPKPRYEEVKEIVSQVKGDFSEARMANEHHATLNETGTPRVWELLPYFAKRATMESLYVEATFTAPLVQWVQGRISLNPSCPARGEWECPTLNFENLDKPLSLLGVRDLILTTTEAITKASQSPQFQLSAKSKSFSVYSVREPVFLAEVSKVEATPYLEKNFKREFMNWFYSWKEGKSPLLFTENFDSVFKNKAYTKEQICEPKVHVDYNLIELSTPCPGYLHILKFTFHPSWKASTGDEIAPISPGFMAIVPSDNKVILRFGQDFRWWIAGFISFVTFLALGLQMRAARLQNKELSPKGILRKVLRGK